MLAGCSSPTRTTTATTASTTATQVVSPPRKLQASPRNITWATTIGLRGQARPRTTSQPQAIRNPASRTKKAAVVAPIAARADSMWAASRTPYPSSSRPSTTTSPAATTSGAGGAEPWSSRIPTAYGAVGAPVGGGTGAGPGVAIRDGPDKKGPGQGVVSTLIPCHCGGRARETIHIRAP